MPAVPASLRLANQATILEQLLERKAASRAELAKATGMSKPTAGKIIDDLVRAGVVEEIKLVDGGRPSVGRPGKQLRLATGRPRFVVARFTGNEQSTGEVGREPGEGSRRGHGRLLVRGGRQHVRAC